MAKPPSPWPLPHQPSPPSPWPLPHQPSPPSPWPSRHCGFLQILQRQCKIGRFPQWCGGMLRRACYGGHVTAGSVGRRRGPKGPPALAVPVGAQPSGATSVDAPFPSGRPSTLPCYAMHGTAGCALSGSSLSLWRNSFSRLWRQADQRPLTSNLYLPTL